MGLSPRVGKRLVFPEPPQGPLGGSRSSWQWPWIWDWVPSRVQALGQGLSRRKGKGYTFGGQAEGNSWQAWPPSSGCRAGRGAMTEGLGEAGCQASGVASRAGGRGVGSADQVCSEGSCWPEALRSLGRASEASCAGAAAPAPPLLPQLTPCPPVGQLRCLSRGPRSSLY